MAKNAKQPTEKKPAAAKKPTTTKAPAAPAPKPEATPAPAPKAKAKAKVERTTKYLPTAVAVVVDGKKPALVIGARRIAAAKGEVVDRGALYWSQIKYARIGRDKSGAFHLTTERAAAAKGYVVIEAEK